MELKECPFCGCKARMAENVSVYGTMFAACCDDVEGCPAGTPGNWWKSEDEAVAKWNTRSAQYARAVIPNERP